MNWQEFFEDFIDCSIDNSHYKNATSLTIERLYQAFKARLIDEIAMSIQEEGEIETSDYIYVEGGGFLKKKRND